MALEAASSVRRICGRFGRRYFIVYAETLLFITFPLPILSSRLWCYIKAGRWIRRSAHIALCSIIGPSLWRTTTLLNYKINTPNLISDKYPNFQILVILQGFLLWARSKLMWTEQNDTPLLSDQNYIWTFKMQSTEYLCQIYVRSSSIVSLWGYFNFFTHFSIQNYLCAFISKPKKWKKKLHHFVWGEVWTSNPMCFWWLRCNVLSMGLEVRTSPRTKWLSFYFFALFRLWYDDKKIILDWKVCENDQNIITIDDELMKIWRRYRVDIGNLSFPDELFVAIGTIFLFFIFLDIEHK